MRPMLLMVLAGCLDSTAEPGALSGPHAIDSPQAMLIPCETPSGQRAALGIIRGTSCGDTAPRDCHAWRQLLQHPFACQPGVSLDPHADAIVFWLEASGDSGDLSGAVANHIERHRCDSDTEPLLGEGVLTRGGASPVVDFDAEDLLGAQTFRACR